MGRRRGRRRSEGREEGYSGNKMGQEEENERFCRVFPFVIGDHRLQMQCNILMQHFLCRTSLPDPTNFTFN